MSLSRAPVLRLRNHYSADRELIDVDTLTNELVNGGVAESHSKSQIFLFYAADAKADMMTKQEEAWPWTV